MRRRYYGCVIFDDPSVHRSGWASVEGARAQRIAGTEDLPSDVVWITNLPFELMGPSGFAHHARFRRDTYLRRHLRQILSDLGASEEPPNRQAEILSTVLMRVMALAGQWLGLRGGAPDGSLAKGIRNIAPDFPVSVLEPELVNALADASGAWVSVERPGIRDPDLRFVTFRLPPARHAIELLTAARDPVGEWRRLKPSELPDAPQTKISEWIKELPGPVVASIVVQSFDPDFNRVINYGSGAIGPTRGKHWATDVELMWLDMFAEVKVTGGWVCDAWRTAPIVSMLQPAAHPACELSYSAGVLLECVWTGMTLLPADVRASSQGFPANAFAPFLRAHDRGRCLAAASRLFGMGLDVVGYGVGKVGLLVDASVGPDELMAIAEETGLLPPACGLDPQADVIPDDADALRIAQSLAAYGQWAMSLKHDRAAVEKLLRLTAEDTTARKASGG